MKGLRFFFVFLFPFSLLRFPFSLFPSPFSLASQGAALPSQRALILSIEDGRNPTAAELKLLVALARANDRSGQTETRALAIRALGRLERCELIPVLLDLVRDQTTRAPAALAAVVTLRACARQPDSDVDRAVDLVLGLSDSTVVLAQLPYRAGAQVEIAEGKLLARSEDPKAYPALATAFEVLARRHRKIHELKPETIEFLKRGAGRSLPLMDSRDDQTPRMALAALVSAGAADEDVVSAGLRDRDEHVRRLAVVALSAGGSAVDTALRTRLLGEALADRSHFVRYEAVRGWARHETAANGCRPLVGALSDDNPHVVLLALDVLGDRCRDDDDITDRLAGESRTPPTIGEWQREAHALVALAKRAPDRAAISMPSFVAHTVWQVRMYAARAAAAMNDAQILERLAYDADHNVREATLAPLRRLKGSSSDPVFIAALGGTDYQLLRTAATVLKGAPHDTYVAKAIADALERVTKDRKDTSRDTRLALIERLREISEKEYLGVYERLLKDFDPQIAAAASDACSQLASRACVADPQPALRPSLPSAAELTTRVKAVVELDSGRKFTILMHRDVAPLAIVRFLRLARSHYYDGLTFHRVEPAFVIQGGSPGANEYAGDGPFMRDELGGSHRRGTIGVSTRGRDTGDAQIFVNLVDNPRLDFEYTIFGHVPAAEMPVADTIQEGTRILRITVMPE
jgi:cyclophilin family peptidyl-prolyl cis-trans isomerase